MIQIKKFQESLTSIVFHATDVNSVLDILKTDKFTLATNLGTGADKIGGGKWYYMSFSTIKYGGYSRSLSFAGQAILVIDGDRLNQKYKGVPVDYWGPEYRIRGREGNGEMALRNDENEERLVTDNPEIPNATKYIKEIHICFSEKEITDQDKVGEAYYDYREGKFRLDDIKTLAKAKNIPCYFYSSPKAFMSLDKRKVLGWDRTSTIQALIDVYEYYLGKSIEEIPKKYPYDRIERALRQAQYATKQKSEYKDQEFITGLMNDIHNDKGSTSGRVNIANLTNIMRKEKVRELWDLIMSMASKMKE